MERLLRFTFGVLLACLLVSCDTPTSAPPKAAMPQPTGKVAIDTEFYLAQCASADAAAEDHSVALPQ
jgi:hypothetical protein